MTVGRFFFFIFYLTIALLAYGWQGVFWAIPLAAVIELGLWSLAWTYRDRVMDMLKEEWSKREKDK